jgi:hypothetical protein
MHKAATVASAMTLLAATWALSPRAAAQQPTAGTPAATSTTSGTTDRASSPPIAGPAPDDSVGTPAPSSTTSSTADHTGAPQPQAARLAPTGRKAPIIVFSPTPAGGVNIDDAEDPLIALFRAATTAPRPAAGTTEQDTPLTPIPRCTAWVKPCPIRHPHGTIRLGSYQLAFVSSGEVILAPARWPGAAFDVPAAPAAGDQATASTTAGNAPGATGSSVGRPTLKDWASAPVGSMPGFPPAGPASADVRVANSIKSWVSRQPDGRFIVSLRSNTQIETPDAPPDPPPASEACQIEVPCPKPPPSKPH